MNRPALALLLLAVSALAACSSDTNGSGDVVSSPATGISSTPASSAPAPSTPAASSAPAPTTGAGSTGPPSPGPSVPVGSYSGATEQGRALSLYVSADGASLQDVSIRAVQLDCTPGTPVLDQLAIASVPLAADHSFSVETTQDGAFGDGRAHFTYLFAGNLASTGDQGTTTGTGTFRETITYTDTVKHACTTNDQTWTVKLDQQPAQTDAVPPPGAYTGATSQGRALTFSVTTGPARVQNITVPAVGLLCVPGGTAVLDHFTIATAAIDGHRSFRATKVQQGIFGGLRAQFAVQFSGTFHGLDSSGRPRAAGSFRETITYTDTQAHTCTSDDQTWTATRAG